VLVKKVSGARFLRVQMRCDILETCGGEKIFQHLRSRRKRLRTRQINAATRCATQPNPKKIRSQFFHAEAHISTQSPQPFEDTRLSQPHEDQERRCGSFQKAREGP